MSWARIRYPTMKEYPKAEMITWLVAGFNHFEVEIEALGYSIADFAHLFYHDYISGRPIYTTGDEIEGCLTRVHMHNKKKYEVWMQVYAAEYDPIENYNRMEESTKIRTPDLTQETEAESERKQTRTTTETPNNWQENDLRKVAPYDSEELHDAEKTERTITGTRSTSESYTGQPDTASSTTTTTGTDTETIESTIHGNIGVTTSQMMLLSSLDLAERLKFVQEIERDCAKELLLQVWI